jgi:hypothetical protein
MFLDADQVHKAFYDVMKKHWSQAQIMELGAFIVFHYGMQMLMRSLGAAAAVWCSRHAIGAAATIGKNVT